MISLADIAVFVKANYSIKLIHVTQLTDKVFKLQTQNEAYVLKFARDDDLIMKQLYAHKELPDNVLPIYKTKSGASFAHHEEGLAYLTDYITRIPIPFEKQVADYIQILQKLHTRTGLDVEQHDVEITNMYNENYQLLAANFSILEHQINRIEMKIARSPFEWYVMMVYPLLYGMYRRSDDAMQKFYRGLFHKKQRPVAMTHGDINAANILPSTKTSYLINFENSGFDSPAQDLLLFLSHYHQLPGIRNMVAGYLKEQKNQLVAYDFFMRTLCIDLISVFDDLVGNSLLDISVLNERIAPGMVAMQIYDEMNAQKKPEKKQGTTPKQSTSDNKS